MIKQFFNTIQGWLTVIVGGAIAVMYGLLRIRTRQRDIAHAEAALHEQNAETATELNQTYTDLDRVKTDAREQANEKLKTDIKRPESGVDLNSL